MFCETFDELDALPLDFTPAEYRVTGVMTFLVGPDGVVYEKDLGPDTLKTFQSMDKYNPDKSWKVTEDDVEDDEDQGSASQGQ